MKSFRLLSSIISLSLLLSSPLRAVHEVTSKDALHTALKGSKKVAIKVGADWCGACKKSATPFDNAALKFADIKAITLNADNKEFRKFIRTFGIDGLPTTVYLKKVESSDPEYDEIAKMLGIEGKSTIVLTKKDVGSRNQEEFERSLSDLSGAKAEQAKPQVEEKKPAKKVRRAKKAKKPRAQRARVERKKARYADTDEMAQLGFPMAEEQGV